MSPISVWQRGAHCSAGCAPVGAYSIKGEFDGAVVLLTGASGYIGSVVLEQLLRTTNVATVYLLLRPRRGQSIQARADVLLQGALFHKIRDSTKLVQKVKVIGGDISMPGLGLSAVDRATLLSSVDFIVHCAADIRLEADIQETLGANFEGTRSVLELAAAADHLKALVHVSSAFVNMNQPRSSTVDEQIYPLKFGNQVVDVEELARELLGMSKRDANMRAEFLLRRWNFPNTYTMGKHMSEQLVARYHAKQQLPIAIVRPSLVSAIAGEPYPGYVGNWAGPIGAGAAMAIGMFDCIESVASQPMGVWDVVPADLVAGSIIAAAAAISAGVAAAITRTTQSGSIAGSAADAAVVFGQPHPLSPEAHAACLHHLAESHDVHTPPARHSAASIAQIGSPDLSATVKIVPDAHELEALKQTGTISSTSAVLSQAGNISGPLSARSDDTAMYHAGRVPDLDLPLTDADTTSSAATSSLGSPKMRGIAASREVHSVKLTHQLLQAVNVHGEDAHSDEMVLSDGITEVHGQAPLLIVHAATSSTYPIALMEGWNYNVDFFDAHPPPFRITMGAVPKMAADFVPTDANVMACRRRVWYKVWAISSILRLLGREKEAKKLVVGYETFCVHNNSKTDRDLVFSTRALVALEAALNPAEAPDYLLVWRPITNRNCSRKDSDSGGKARGDAKQKQALAGVLGRSGAQLSPVEGDITWKRYLHTQMAGIYRLMFGIELQKHKAMASAVARAEKEGTALHEEDFIQHDFRRIK